MRAMCLVRATVFTANSEVKHFDGSIADLEDFIGSGDKMISVGEYDVIRLIIQKDDGRIGCATCEDCDHRDEMINVALVHANQFGHHDGPTVSRR